MAGSEYAKRLMKKQGWKEGSGLGKKEHGIADPIKVTLKMDKTGVGHDPGKEFTDHWWLRVFNEAAQKIGKKKEAGEDEDEKKQKKADEKKSFYKGFVKSSTLTNGVELSAKDSDSSEDESISNHDTRLPTLDDIHKFCGGATGHRAAMFGIKMKGKLSRVAEQESNFEKELKKTKQLPDGDSTVHSGTADSQKVEKKRKRKILSETTDIYCHDRQEEVNNESQEINSEKVKKKKKKRKEKDAKSCLERDDIDNGYIEKKIKKKKQKKDIESPATEVISEEGISKKKKKRKKDFKS